MSEVTLNDEGKFLCLIDGTPPPYTGSEISDL
jgi:hypothetical protein